MRGQPRYSIVCVMFMGRMNKDYMKQTELITHLTLSLSLILPLYLSP